jgi:pimeloyl-ACP methyl ester carboxylesterase
MSGIRPFRIGATETELEDLRRRLLATRWPEPETVDDWSQGVPLGYLKDVIGYWARDYDRRSREAQLNRFPQYQTRLADIDIHFIHVRSAHGHALPLLMTHGWPGSIIYWNELPRGGHFAAFEQPELFTDEVRRCFRLIRALPKAANSVPAA